MDPATQLLLIVTLVSLAVVGWSGRKRFPLRIGVGNFFRRKTQVALVVAGLLIGTAIISSSYVIQDTFDYTIRSAVFRQLDHVDEVLFIPASDGSRAFFDESIFDELVASRPAMPHVDGLAPRIHVSAGIVDIDSGLFEPQVTAIGFDAPRDLGTFTRADGTTWDGSGLGAEDAILNARLARELDADVGDRLVVFFLGSPANLTVRHVVPDVGRAAWNDAPLLFLRLDALQGFLGVPGQINTILASNVGGVTDGYLVTDRAVAELDAALDPTWGLVIQRTKAEAIEQATEGVSQLAQLFVLLGTFTIISGVLLIMNIFVMLAEERKGEMGVARAVGMRRSNLVQSFVAEGLLYALLSATIGAFAGLAVAGVILWAFERIFPPEFLGGLRFVLTFTPASLTQAFALGFLITMGTITIATWRVSKLNIVRAIRDIPEPIPHRSTRGQVALGTALALAGLGMTWSAFMDGPDLFQPLGPSVLALGLAAATMRVVGPRIAFSAAGAFILFWILNPWPVFELESPEIYLFIAAGLLLVLGGLLIVLFNSDTLLAVITRVVRRRTLLPVLRTAISYPMNKKFRTGATLAMIALVMFTIATMSGIQAMTASSIATISERQSGGYDLLATTNAAIPKPNWTAEFQASTASPRVDEMQALSLARARVTKNETLAGPGFNYSVVGVTPEWASQVRFQFQYLDPAYPDGRAVWQAVVADPGLGILDGNAVQQAFGPTFGVLRAQVGDVLYYRNGLGEIRSVRVVGILYQQFVSGLFLGWDAVRSDFGVDYPSLFYFRLKPGESPLDVGRTLEREFVRYQLTALDIHGFIEAILEVNQGVLNLLQAYLALGLVVGIAGLGVITMRNVVERRAETGALRALGFRRSMVLKSFLLELSFIALTGIVMGIALGVALSYNLWQEFFSDSTGFVVPWARLGIYAGVAFGTSVLATASPAVRAAKMPPAEALRTFE